MISAVSSRIGHRTSSQVGFLLHMPRNAFRISLQVQEEEDSSRSGVPSNPFGGVKQTGYCVWVAAADQQSALVCLQGTQSVLVRHWREGALRCYSDPDVRSAPDQGQGLALHRS
jgi:hypothetical protein